MLQQEDLYTQLQNVQQKLKSLLDKHSALQKEARRLQPAKIVFVLKKKNLIKSSNCNSKTMN